MTETYGDLRSEAQKKSDALAVARVKAGIALLEENFGPNWVDSINPAMLTLSDSTYCVLGQLYGSYGNGRIELDIRSTGFEYGFDAGGDVSYGSLDRVWRAEIEAARPESS